MSEAGALAQDLRAALAAAADPARAPAMQAYMKSAMPFHGVSAPARRAIVAEVTMGRTCLELPALQALLLALWRTATHREERHAALDLLRLPRHRKLVAWPLLPAIEEILATDPWWDFNDEVSGSVLPLFLQRHPQEMKAVLRRWAQGEDLWFRRAAMLAQRSLKRGFDAVLFYDCLLPSLTGGRFADEFFIRKGMGWALRERAYDAPDEVRAFCQEYEDRLSPLTLREALRVINLRTSFAAPASP